MGIKLNKQRLVFSFCTVARLELESVFSLNCVILMVYQFPFVFFFKPIWLFILEKKYSFFVLSSSFPNLLSFIHIVDPNTEPFIAFCKYKIKKKKFNMPFVCYKIGFTRCVYDLQNLGLWAC